MSSSSTDSGNNGWKKIIAKYAREEFEHYGTNSYIHGIPDLHKAKDSRSKRVWLFFMWSSVVAMICHISIKTVIYSRNIFGTHTHFSPAASMPPVLFCPDTWFDPAMVEKFGLTSELQVYVESLFGMGQYAKFYQKKDISHKSNAEVERLHAELHRKLMHLGMNLDDLLEAVSYSEDHFIEHRLLFPLTSPQNVNVNKVVNLIGICYLIEVPGLLPILVLQYGGLHFDIINITSSKLHPQQITRTNAFGQIFVGDDVRYVIPEGQFLLEEGYQYDLRASRTRFIQDPADASVLKCIDLDQSSGSTGSSGSFMDPSRCYLEAYNQRCADSCISFIPRSKTLPSSSVNSLQQRQNSSLLSNYCSYLGNASSCIWKGLNNPDIASFPCYMPCTQDVYSVSILKTGSSSTSVYIRLDNPLSSVTVREFVRTGFADYAADFGGILSLWFGASMLSLAQIAYYVIGFIGRLHKKRISMKTQTRHSHRNCYM